MENQSLIAARKDDGGKQKKGLATLLVTVSTAILLLGLVFYVGEYHHRGSPRVVPPGLEHPVCRYGQCRSGQPGASCGQTSDCVIPPGLEHPVCRNDKCQR